MNEAETRAEHIDPALRAAGWGVVEGSKILREYAITPDEVPEPQERQPNQPKIRVKLADGKERTIAHMMMTSFWHPDGTPTSAQQFMELLFGKLPDFFKDETELRAANAKVHINTHFDAKQQVFLDFVLQHYIKDGVEELDQEKLTPLLRLKYHDSIQDAVADLGGKPEEINKAFAGFQKYLYAAVAS